MTETVFSQALAEIRRRGWTQGKFGPVVPSLPEPVCIYGAFTRTGIIDDDKCENIEFITSLTQRLNEHVGQNITAWNDTHGRTQAEVEQVLMDLHEKELAEKGEMV